MSHGANKDMLAAAAKADALKAEYEDETAKFEACQVSTPCVTQPLANEQ